MIDYISDKVDNLHKLIALDRNFVKIEQLMPGERGKITGFASGAPLGYRQKLLSMGLIPGVEFVISQIAPLGDPMSICVKNYVISLRKLEAAVLEVVKVV